MKKWLSYFTVVIFAATLLLNLSLDSNGNLTMLTEAKAAPPKPKGPYVLTCTYNGNVYAYATGCNEEGTLECVPTDCPPKP